MWQPNPSFKADWIAADWGTSRLRLWAVAASGAVMAIRETEEGMAGLEAGEFEDRLLKAVENWLVSGTVTPVIICGMAGAREGWAEAGYRPVPARLPDWTGAIKAPTRDPRLDVRILPGLSQEDPADVMRGEETQIAGLLSEEPDFDGLVVLPGTHTKWVRVSGGMVRSFSTYITGELFHLLGTKSILRHSLNHSDGWDWAQFDDALEGALANPAGMTQRLFGLRARALLQGLDPAGVRARLSAELIGTEIAALWKGATGLPVMLVGTDELNSLYRHALALAGIEAETRSAQAMTLAGVTAAWKGLRNA